MPYCRSRCACASPTPVLPDSLIGRGGDSKHKFSADPARLGSAPVESHWNNLLLPPWGQWSSLLFFPPSSHLPLSLRVSPSVRSGLDHPSAFLPPAPGRPYANSTRRGHWPTFLESEARALGALAGREAALGYLCSAAPTGTVRLLPRGVQVVLPLSPRGRCRAQVLTRTRACGRAFRSWRSLTPRGGIPVPLPTSGAPALVEFAQIGRSADPDKASPAPSP